MNYLCVLLCNINLSLLDLQPGEERWAAFPLSDSYEHEIIEGKGACSVKEYRQIFFEKGLSVRHLEVQHDMMSFRNLDELKQWIRKEIAPRLDTVCDENFVEYYFQLLQERGWLDIGDGRIRFPHKQLLVLISA